MRRLRGFFLLQFAAACFLATLCSQPALRAAPPATPELRPEIQQLYKSGHYREAAKALADAASANGQDAALHFWLGRCFYELRDYSRAIASFERAATLEPNRSEFHDWLGRAYGHKAEETNVLAAFTSLALARRTNHEFAAAVRLDANNLEAQRDLIRYLSNAPGIVGGSDDHAQDQIKILAQIDSVEADLARAEMLADHRIYDKANEKYQAILAGKPARLEAYLEIAQYYRDRADAEHIDQSVALAGLLGHDDPRIGYYKAIALVLRKKDPARAEGYLRAYLAKEADSAEVPSHASAHEWLGQLYEWQGKLDAAVGEYHAALALDPRNKNVRDSLRKIEKQ